MSKRIVAAAAILTVLAFSFGYFIGERTHSREVTMLPFDPAVFNSTPPGEDIRTNFKKLSENLQTITRHIDSQKR